MGDIYTDIWDINERAIDPKECLDFVTTDENGAETIFIGTVRNHNIGKKVLGVSYDVFASLAIESFQEICREAQSRWGDELCLYLVHAKGRLDIGGISVAIGVGSPHRDEAFQACRYLIEEIKHRSPVWKLEHYTDGDSEWTKGCELCEHKHQHIAAE